MNETIIYRKCDEISNPCWHILMMLYTLENKDNNFYPVFQKKCGSRRENSDFENLAPSIHVHVQVKTVLQIY